MLLRAVRSPLTFIWRTNLDDIRKINCTFLTKNKQYCKKKYNFFYDTLDVKDDCAQIPFELVLLFKVPDFRWCLQRVAWLV